ncbi:carboxyvinyl-carboxyphosphonate phosphorylmutase [Devosia yakushimensis]|uniref:Carboxyvinyl-carboxyphosphonate phosphorylmutase n=1 Tax=Devosia yakushimensis TaxID=470028 RepID=A0ABQ5UCT8_9HYPH|nr:isocitrate lyase/phosphoenolpyruvate mutase family protein [Devosia yakushimensis]GLQ09674.1 carboxyvinyl-carboxyphosphonate phosphorylmutase [Devosia yakushimensis]
MSQTAKASQFASLHVPGNPLVIYNAWDAGSAIAIAAAGAKAIGTGSWSVAAAQGYQDGQALPLALLEQVAGRIVASVDLPVSIDFEGAYAEAPQEAAANVMRLIALGVVGINFEDQVVDRGDAVYPITDQQARIDAIRTAASTVLPDFFINARTDLFLQAPADRHAGLVGEAIERGKAYKAAGASGFFVPGLADPGLIGTVCREVALPVNVMKSSGVPGHSELGALGVARISYGPGPYRKAMTELTRQAADVFA